MLFSAVKALVAERYQSVHAAKAEGAYQYYETIFSGDLAQSTLGYRFAGDSALFLEAYLGEPVEQVLERRLGHRVERERIVEIGDHASRSALATLALWRTAASRLEPQADYVAAVLTAPLRSMFRRIGLDLIELAPAAAASLPGAGEGWGRYYQSDPVVCAGHIASGLACFDRWADKLERSAR